MSQFIYLLNAMERAAQAENPAEHDYGAKRRAVLEYVAKLETTPPEALRIPSVQQMEQAITHAVSFRFGVSLVGINYRPPEFARLIAAQVVEHLTEETIPSPLARRQEFPQHAEVKIVFTKDAMYVDTGDQVPGMGNIAYKVNDEQAKSIMDALRARSDEKL